MQGESAVGDRGPKGAEGQPCPSLTVLLEHSAANVCRQRRSRICIVERALLHGLGDGRGERLARVVVGRVCRVKLLAHRGGEAVDSGRCLLLGFCDADAQVGGGLGRRRARELGECG